MLLSEINFGEGAAHFEKRLSPNGKYFPIFSYSPTIAKIIIMGLNVKPGEGWRITNDAGDIIFKRICHLNGKQYTAIG